MTRAEDGLRQDLTAAILLLLDDFYRPDEARHWLDSPQRALGNRVPAQLIAAGMAGEVIGLLGQLREGAYI